MNASGIRTRWAAVGAAVAVTLGAGSIGLVSATSPSDAVAYVALDAPCRAADTRPGVDNVGVKATPIGSGATHTINANDGKCSGLVPGSATSLQLNVTALNSTIASFLTIWPGGARPQASSLNPTPGQPPVPNAVTTKITGGGDFNIYNNAGSVDVVVDIAGYYIDHNHDDRYYTEAEVDGALDGKATAAFVQSGSITNTGSVFAGPSFSIDELCGDPDGCRITLTNEYDGSRYIAGPINFYYDSATGKYWDYSSPSPLGTSGDGIIKAILATTGGTQCLFSDWSASNADPNTNFGVVHSNVTTKSESCTVKIED